MNKSRVLIPFIIMALLAGLARLAAAQEVALHIFGGRDHTHYLGCLNCDSNDELSIWNKQGRYGDNFFGDNSCIWYAFNPYAQDRNGVSFRDPNTFSPDVPIIVDDYGHFYGYFTANKRRPDRCRMRLLDVIITFYDAIRRDTRPMYDLWYGDEIRVRRGGRIYRMDREDEYGSPRVVPTPPTQDDRWVEPRIEIPVPDIWFPQIRSQRNAMPASGTPASGDGQTRQDSIHWGVRPGLETRH